MTKIFLTIFFIAAFVFCLVEAFKQPYHFEPPSQRCFTDAGVQVKCTAEWLRERYPCGDYTGVAKEDCLKMITVPHSS